MLKDVSLTIRQGEVLGLVGESRSDNSSLALAVMRHLTAIRPKDSVCLPSSIPA